jgi:dipeptidyl aminopeptidase/acylaminoacyl peptidase
MKILPKIQRYLLGWIFVANLCFATDKIPLEDFFRSLETINVQISPSGEYLIYGKSWEHRINIFVKKLETNEIKQLTFSINRDVERFCWVNDDLIIYRQDNNGDENFHLFAVSSNGGDVKDLTPFEGVCCQIVDKSEKNGKILIAMNKRNKQLFDMYRLDTKSGVIELVAENPGDVTSCLIDHEGNLRIAIFTDGANQGIRYRESEKDDWKTISFYNYKDMITPLLFTFDNKQIYVSSNADRDKQAIFTYDLKTGKEIECIFEDPNFDISASTFTSQPLIISTKRKKILGCSYIAHKLEFKIYDELYKKIMNFIDVSLPNYENCIVSCDKDETKYIVYSKNDKTLGFYYLFDVNKWEMKKLFDCSPWLKESDMCSKNHISYISSDGLIIHGYLTLPKDQNHKKLPLVVKPHGGPWSRNVWTFDASVQFLANRGYAVLQMNYRGSSGYGRKFLQAGYKQWGLKMQDDITDGVRWLCDQGIVDPKKVAIFGGSYGGYAALSGITKTPDLYAAAIDYEGISNIFNLLESMAPYKKPLREMFYEMIGHPINDKEQLIATSPIFNVDKIKTPLLIAQGVNDPRVKKDQSDQLVESLSKRGVSVDYILKNNEGHGFSNEENLFEFYRAVEAFLQKHIGDSASSIISNPLGIE